MRFSATQLFGIAASYGVLAQSATVVVANGTIEGGKCSSTGANAFLGIPYAQPPLGELRFTPPRPHDSKYSGTLQATSLPPSCAQFSTSFLTQGAQSEDCLFLNIWTPSNTTETSKLPVKVWLYGGGDQTGGIADPMYDGCSLASDAVVVTVNYRLGPLGWISLTAGNLTGNYGLSDQLLALQWVQDNIEAFGGDKTKVLLFGESAGAFNTWAITTLPQAPKLMKAAVMQSGAGVPFATVKEADAWNELFTTKANCSLADAVSCLRSKSLAELNDTVNAMPAPEGIELVNAFTIRLGRGEDWGAVVDGKVVPVQPTDVGARVPSIMGSNAQEGTLFILNLYQTGVTSLNASVYDAFLAYNFGPWAQTINATYPLANFSSSFLPVFSAMVAVFTDYAFRCPTHRGLLATANNTTKSPVYTYSWEHTLSCPWTSGVPNNTVILGLLGPSHSSEIPFAFANVDRLPRPAGTCALTAAERNMSDFIASSWTRMAADGTPGEGWPAWRADASTGVRFGANASEVGAVDYSMCEFWDRIAGEIAESNAANKTAEENATTTAPGSGSGTSETKTGDPKNGARGTGVNGVLIWTSVLLGLLGVMLLV